MAFKGVLVPVLTPFTRDLAPDQEKFVRICRHLLDQGAAGLSVFGTTSEGNSLSPGERMALLEALIEAGIPPAKLMPGTGSSALAEAIALADHATRLGCGGVLVLPPHYFKHVDDDGLFAFFDRLIAGVGSDGLKIYLYHIPQVAGVGFSLELVGRLLNAHPQAVVGIKNSVQAFDFTEALLLAYPDLAVYPGYETFLLPSLRLGGAGTITGLGNVNLPMIVELYEGWRDPGAEALQARVEEIRRTISEIDDLIPVLKGYWALKSGDPDWAITRPPLRIAKQSVIDELDRMLRAMSFQMSPPGIG